MRRCEDDVRAATLAAAERLAAAGAEVEEVSVPLHRESAWEEGCACGVLACLCSGVSVGCHVP